MQAEGSAPKHTVKTMPDTEPVIFQWPKTPEEVKVISYQQVEWLFQGLKIEQNTALQPVEMSLNGTCF